MADQTFKKECGYDSNTNNWQGESEIMVTITLNEYRQLVTSQASKDTEIKKAEADRYERNKENTSLKEENASLKAELYGLKKALDDRLSTVTIGKALYWLKAKLDVDSEYLEDSQRSELVATIADLRGYLDENS